MRHFAYIMFISSNRTLFQFWQLDNLEKHQNVSKYYNSDCLKNIIFLFLSLLTTKLVKESHIKARMLIIFLNIVLKQPWNSFNNKFQYQWKDQKAVLSMENARTLLPVNCSNFKLKQCNRSQSYEKRQEN